MRPIFAATLLCSTMATLAHGQSVPTGFVVDTIVSSGLTAANDFCWLPDGRVLFANRPGAVSVLANGTLATVGTVPNVETGSERALLGIAADPAFATNGHIYVWYSSSLDNFMHLDRFTCTGDLANPASTNLAFASTSRTVILANPPDNAFNHNGGSPRFGPDGKLYLSIGDDANACQAQLLATQQGALLRMDVSTLPAGGNLTPPAFSVLDPGDNPLSANTDFSQLVIAHGLRNPVRITIDPNTSNVYIADVGQTSHEECSEYVYQQGALQLVNFGWPWREGNASYTTCGGTQPAGLVPPIVDIPRAQNWTSVMACARYRNRSGQFDFGAGYEGKVFYGDYFAGEIRLLQQSAGVWSPAPTVPGQPTASNWAQNIAGLVSVDTGADGGLYVLHHPSPNATTGGFFKRIRPLGPVNGVVVVAGNNQRGPATESFPVPVVFQVNDPQGNPLAGGQVNLSVTGPGTLSTTNPVIADANGRVQTTVTANNAGGAITVRATTPGGDPAGVTANLFSRKMTIVSLPTLFVMQVNNTTAAVPAQVPFVVAASAPGILPLQTGIGPICTNPLSPLTFILEDSTGAFGFVSLSGSGAMGTPSLSKTYTVPSGALTGITLWFQAVGIDPIEGPFRTNCELKTL